MSDEPEPPIAPFPALDDGSPFPPLGREFETLAAQDAEPEPPTFQPAPTADPADAGLRFSGPVMRATVFNTPPQDGEAAPSPAENALFALGHSLGRFAFPPEPAPDDDDLAGRDRRWTSRVILLLAAFMLVFNAASIQNWARQQAPGWTTSTVQQLSDVWSAQIALLGADRPRQAVRDAWTGLTELRFPGQGTAQDSAVEDVAL